jgi:hypothetical protein
VSSYIADVANAREIAMIHLGRPWEKAKAAAPSLNVLPKEGGNALRGTFFAAGVTSGMVGSNYTQDLKDRGLSTPGVTRKVWDFNLGIGGPIAKDRVWYYANNPRRGQRAHGPRHVRERQTLASPMSGRTAPIPRAPRCWRRPIGSRAALDPRRPRKRTSSWCSTTSSCLRGRCCAWLLGRRVPQIWRRRNLRRIDRGAHALGIRDRRARDGGRTARSVTA